MKKITILAFLVTMTVLNAAPRFSNFKLKKFCKKDDLVGMSKYLAQFDKELFTKTYTKKAVLYNLVYTPKKSTSRIKMLELMQSYGADINRVQGKHNLLTEALYRSHVDLVFYLLDKGYDWKAKPGSDYNFLHRAVFTGNLELIKKALSFGIDINSQTEDGTTSLFFAVSSRNKVVSEPITLFLLEKGAKIKESNKRGINGFFEQVMYEKKDKVLKLCLEKGKIDANFKNQYGHSLLGNAIEAQYTPNVALLLKHGATVTKEDIQKAADRDNNDILDLLEK